MTHVGSAVDDCRRCYPEPVILRLGDVSDLSQWCDELGKVTAAIFRSSRRFTAGVQAIYDTVKIDPVRLSPNSSFEPLELNCQLNWRPGFQAHLKQRTRVGRFLTFLYKALYLLPRLKCPLPQRHRQELAVAIFTTNQVNALRPVIAELQRRGLAVRIHATQTALASWQHSADSTEECPTHDSVKGSESVEGPDSLEGLAAWSRWLAMPFLPVLLVRMLVTRGYPGRSYAWALDEYWQGYGLYLACRWWFQAGTARGLLVSNDHGLFPCCIEQAARDQGIPTFYLQHACVTNRFPPLRVNCALLDGRDALDKYSGAGETNSTVYLVGMPKYDRYVNQINRSTVTERLGVCLSMADDIERSLGLLQRLADANLGMKITVRPHPRTQPAVLQRIRNLQQELGLLYSGKEEKAFDFLSKQDVVISGVSSITLEAALLNVTPINFVLNELDRDWYGFVELGLCESYSQTSGLVNRLVSLKEQRPDLSEQVQHYCETVGTSWHGQSALLAADVIESMCEQTETGGSPWERIANTRIEAYGLR